MLNSAAETKKKLISVVVPAYREEKNLPLFYEELLKATAGAPYEIEMIIVNDGSSDGTLSVLKEISSKDSRLTAINFSRNWGSYAAIEAGLQLAKGDAIMTISADLQDHPSIINPFYQAWKEGYDVVWGVRDGREDPFFKALFAKTFYWIVRTFIFKDFPLDGMDIGLFDKRIIAQYLKMQERNSIPFFAIYYMGFNQKRIPYLRKERKHGESGWPFWKRVKCAIDIIVGFSYIPLRSITFAGLSFAVLSFLYGTAIVFLRVFNIVDVLNGWSSLAVLVSFIGGIQMCFLGVIAEYIWRITDRVKNRPVFFVMDIIKNGERFPQ